MKVGIISLGCAKNRVDSETILGALKNAKHTITNNPKEADVIFINTCAFIKDAQVESLNTIIDMMEYQKKIIVTGCLAEIFAKELKEDYPKLDVIPYSKYSEFTNYLNKYLKDKKDYYLNPLNRCLTTSANFAYLKIAEGCNNFCSFCAIPYIRGRYRSRTISSLVKETKLLAKQGITELAVIAQDISNYGIDLKDGSNLVTLLREISKVNGIKHIRLLYLYPSEITDEFVNYVKNNKKIYPYFDIPLQHADEAILKSMNRKGSHKQALETLNKIRKTIPNAIFRSTFIVGYPGETNASFKKLLNFVKEFKFDHLGAFTYSREESTKAYALPNQVNEKIKNLRRDTLMKEQSKISYQKNLKHINEELTGLCLGLDKDTNYYYFLTKYNGPDDIDGSVIAKSKKPLKVGEYYKLKVKDAFVYDLLVEIKK